MYNGKSNYGNAPHMPIGTVVNGQILTQNGWKPYKKKSGAKTGIGRNDMRYVVAWNSSKSRGLIKIKAFENKKSKPYTRDNGDKVISLMFEIFYTRTGNKVLELGFFNENTGKVVLGDSGFVISCKSPNGGYCGQYRKK